MLIPSALDRNYKTCFEVVEAFPALPFTTARCDMNRLPLGGISTLGAPRGFETLLVLHWGDVSQ
jgi:hypothetical protein